MIGLRLKGNFKKLNRRLEKIKEAINLGYLDKYGKLGVQALTSATPIDTGNTAESWDYEIVRKDDSVALQFTNSNIQNGVQIAVILQYGHATRNGGWVEGRDYINPAIVPIFDEIAEDLWKEVTAI